MTDLTQPKDDLEQRTSRPDQHIDEANAATEWTLLTTAARLLGQNLTDDD